MIGKKVIYISAFLPEPTIPEAGQKISYQNLQAYLDSGCEVHLLSFMNQKEKSYYNDERFSKCASVEIFEIDGIRRLWNVLKNPFLPLVIGVRNDSRMKRSIQSTLKNSYSQDYIIHVEHQQALANIASKSYDKTNIVLHDIISQSLTRFHRREVNKIKKAYYYVQLILCRYWEGNLKKLSHCIVLNSKDERILINNGVSSSKITINYPIVDPFFSNINRSFYNNKALLFWGAMNRKENEDAVIWFIEKIFPKVKNEISDVIFYIVGSNPSNHMMGYASDCIVITGFVESPQKYFELAGVSVVPLRYGAGIKIKVLESLAAKIPVVSTTVGAEGILSDVNLFVTDNEDEFATTIIKLIRRG